MIAKRSARRRDCKSNFKTLAAYILRAGRKEGPAQQVRLTNCGFDQPWAAIKEIEATQDLNSTSQADRTYHLIVSFRPKDNPTPAQLVDCEDELCRSLGYGEHQRVSAVHMDTEHVHMHVAINKVHPETLRNVTPLRDFYKLDEACRVLEERHGLARDNRIDRSRLHENAQDLSPRTTRTREMEAHGGLESFESWIVGVPRNVLAEALEKSDSWNELHRAFAQFDLELRERGAGLAVAARKGKAGIKASALGRQFSRGSLENRFGPYESPSDDVRLLRPEMRYQDAPLHTSGKSSALWSSWQVERGEYDRAKEKIDELRKQRERWKQDRRVEYRKRRATLFADPLLSWRQKRQLCDALLQRRVGQSQRAYREFQAAVQDVYRQHPARGWQTFLVDQATAGNVDALKMLKSRARKGKGLGSPPRNTPNSAPRMALGAFVGRPDAAHVFPKMAPKVLKTGDVLYNLNGARVRDSGARLYLDADRKDGIAAALRMARAKYGDRLRVEGDEAFKRAVVEAVVRHDMSVTFADAGMEKRRQVLTATLTHSTPQTQQPSRRREPPEGLGR